MLAGRLGLGKSMDHLRQVEQAFIDRQAFLEPRVFRHDLHAVVSLLVAFWVRSEVVSDFLTAGEVDEIQITLHRHEAIVSHYSCVLD